jgi:hypothetical protein
MMSCVYANATFGVFTNTFSKKFLFPWREMVNICPDWDGNQKILLANPIRTSYRWISIYVETTVHRITN